MPFYLNAYNPLVRTTHGLKASESNHIPPFVDGSIRREPDLQNRFPSITCICRGENFAPRLDENDIVFYMTKKGKYSGHDNAHYRLTAVLQVIKRFESHVQAATWYRSQSGFKDGDTELGVPSNCIVPENPPLPPDLSSKDPCDPDVSLDEWDGRYQARARANGTFIVCKKRFVDLSWNAPIILKADLEEAFGSTPGTRNPGKKSPRSFAKLIDILRQRGSDVGFEL
jgi:hypothetical protein